MHSLRHQSFEVAAYRYSFVIVVMSFWMAFAHVCLCWLVLSSHISSVVIVSTNRLFYLYALVIVTAVGKTIIFVLWVFKFNIFFSFSLFVRLRNLISVLCDSLIWWNSEKKMMFMLMTHWSSDAKQMLTSNESAPCRP